MGWARSSRALLISGAIGWAQIARADEEPVVPPTEPSLAHAKLHLSYETLGAGFSAPSPEPGGSGLGLVWFAHFGCEYPMIPRKWYVGTSFDVAIGRAPAKPPAALFGDPEFWVRGVWTSKQGLEAGGSIGAIVPTASDLNTRAEGFQRAIEVIRPWDTAFFSRSSLTLRPAFDVAYTRGIFLVQLRQGLDVSYAVDANQGEISGHTDLLLNVTAAHLVDFAFEAFETYDLTRVLRDDQRGALTLGPAISFRPPNLRVGLGGLFPVGTPLGGATRAFVALRLFATFFLH